MDRIQNFSYDSCMITLRLRGLPDPIGDLLDDDEPKRLSASRWAVPNTIDLDQSGQHLVWQWGITPERWIKPSAKILEQFVGLVSAPAQSVLAYAREFGLLGICEHGL